jgi:hypothetical protein
MRFTLRDRPAITFVILAIILLARRARWREWRWLVLGNAIVAVTVAPWFGPLRRVMAMDDYWPASPKPWFIAEYFGRRLCGCCWW